MKRISISGSVKLVAVTAVAIGCMAGSAGASAQRPPDCSTSNACDTTLHPVVVRLGVRRSASPTVADLTAAAALQPNARTPLKCYDEQGWESWNTHIGKNIWYDQIHWCGRAGLTVNFSMTSGSAHHNFVPGWREASGDPPVWSKSWATARHNGVRTDSSGQMVLTDPSGNFTLQDRPCDLAVNVYANGFAKITRHD